MKKRWKLGLLLAALTVFMLQLTVSAAGRPLNTFFCYIAENQVNVITVGSATGDDGQYYLFALKPYETGVGSRTDYCATVPAADMAHFIVPLDLNTASSKLYSRFVVTVRQNGVYVPVSTEMYITNPEAVATASTVSIAEATGNKKGIYTGWQHAADISTLGAGYVVDQFDATYFLNGGGFPYEYNGKVYDFSAREVAAADIKVQTYNAQNVDLVMMILNSNRNGGGSQDLVYPAATAGVAKGSANPNMYAFNVSSQAGEEKLEAWVSFLAERYNGGPGSVGSVHHFIIGNEVNSSYAWHYAGDISEEEFYKEYAKQFRVCYNAIKSHNAGAKVYTCIDQCWTHIDTGHPKSSYSGKRIMDGFNNEIKSTGNINWGLSFHPYSVPLMHTKFWTTKAGYQGLVKNSENTKMVTPMNLDVVTNYFTKPEFFAPADSVSLAQGGVRDIIISELGFNSSAVSADTDENVQAAAIVYAYKLATSNPHIKAVMINNVIDNAEEVAQGLAMGLKRADGTPKPAYTAYMQMDGGDTNYLLPYVGLSRWP